MDWVVLEVIHDAGARLDAVRLSDGERKVLFESSHPMPLHAATNPAGTRVLVDAVTHSKLRGRHRSRLGLVNLERLGVGWPSQSLDPKWHLAHGVFDDTGFRIAYEGAFDGVPISDIYVCEVQISGNSVRGEVVAGAGNPQKLGCARPVFLPGGQQLLYLRNTRPDGAWELCLLDLERSGDSAWLLEGRAPSVLSLTLTEGAEVVPEVPVVYCEPLKTAFWAGKTRGGARQVIRATRLGDRAHRDLGKAHLRIEEICVAPEGELIAYAADGQLWLADTETGAAVALSSGEPEGSHRGLTFDLEGGRLLFCTSDAEGARVRAIRLSDRESEVLHELGDVSVLGLRALPDTLKVNARLSALAEVETEPRRVVEETPTVVDGDLHAALMAELAGDAPAPQAPDLETPPPRVVAPERPPTEEVLAAVAAEVEAHDEARAGGEPEPADDGAAAPEAPEEAQAEEEAPADGQLEAAPDEQDAPSDEQEAAADEPEAAAEEPEAAAEEPGATAEEPEVPADEPEAPTGEPEAAADEPEATADEPEAPADEPEAPADAADEPETLPAADDAEDDTPTAPGMSPVAALDSVGVDPADDFASWMKRVPTSANPGGLLQGLAARKDDVAVREGARLYLGTQRRRAAGRDEAPQSLMFALAAAAHLQLDEARRDLVALCERARPKVERGRLPGIEEHFALAALSHLQGTRPNFNAAEVFGEHAEMEAQRAQIAQDEGEGAAARFVDAHARDYLARLLAALRTPTPPMGSPVVTPVSASLVDLAAQATVDQLAQADTLPPPEEHAASAEPQDVVLREAQALAELATAPTEPPTPTPAPADEDPVAAEAAALAAMAAQLPAALAEPGDERAEIARLEQERAEAARAVEAAERKRAEDEAWQAARAGAATREAEARREAEAAEAEWQAARAAAERAAQAEAEGEAQWQAAKAAAEQRADAAHAAARADAERKAEAARRAAEEAAARVAEAERAMAAAEAARQAAEAAEQAPAPQPAAPAPVAPRPDPQADRRRAFAPLTGPLPAVPGEAKRTGKLPVQRPALDDAAAAFTPGSDPDLDDDPAAAIGLPTQRGRLPVWIAVAGLGAVIGGLSQAIVAAKVGGGFLPMGLLLLVGGLALFADRRAGFTAGVAAYVVNLPWLGFVATRPVPEAHVTDAAYPAWMPREIFWLGLAAALVLVVGLLVPAVSGRYRRGRPGF